HASGQADVASIGSTASALGASIEHWSATAQQKTLWFCPYAGCGVKYCLNFFGVVAAAAKIAAQRVAHFAFRGLWIFPQQSNRAHDHARRAVPALRAHFVDPGLLQRVQLAACRTNAFDGGDLFALSIPRQQHAGINRLAFQQHGASAALAEIAAAFGSRET